MNPLQLYHWSKELQAIPQLAPQIRAAEFSAKQPTNYLRQFNYILT